MNNQKKIVLWLLDIIDTEVTNPDNEVDMVLVDECTTLLGKLISETSPISERELQKRCRAIICDEDSKTY